VSGTNDLYCTDGSGNDITYRDFATEMDNTTWYKISCSWGAEGLKLYVDHELVAHNSTITGGIAEDERGQSWALTYADKSTNLSWLIDEYVLYDYQVPYTTSRITTCSDNSTKCSDVMYVGGKRIRPYLLRCGDYNNDDYYEWPDSSVVRDDGLASVEECEYGCWFNDSIGDVECRNDYYYETCEDIDWECIPGEKRCRNGWLQTCTENPTDSNCYVWFNTQYCDNGCNPDGESCKRCADDCDSGESRCFMNGIDGIDEQTQQSIWYNIPMVVNCTYDYNQKCWRYTVKEMERCEYGCYDQFNDSTNLTSGFCWTAEELEDDWLLNYTSALKETRGELSTYLTMLFPTEGMKYMFSMSFTLIVAGYAGYRAKSMKIGIYLMLGFILLASLTGWLPIWITVILAIGSGFWVMRQLFWRSE